MAGILSYALKLETGEFTGGMNTATGAMKGLAGAATFTAGAIAKVVAPVAALAGGFSMWKVLEKAADMESLSASFETVLGSAKAADEMLKKIVATAASTPYGIEELAQSARRLMAVTEKDEIVSHLRMIGDLASAAQVPIQDLASMYAKIKGSDKIQGDDFQQLSNALPGSLQEFVKVLNVDSVAAVRKLGEEGRITGAALDQVFINLTSKGGMAFGAMAKQSQTTKGLLSTLTDAVSALMVAVGTPINDFLKPIIADNTARLETFTIQFKAFLQLLKSANSQGELGSFIGASLKVAMIEAINVFSGGIRGAVAYLGAALPGIARAFRDSLLFADSLLIAKNIFFGIGDYLEAALLRGAEGIVAAMGLDRDFGSKAAASSSANHFRSAGNLIEDMDLKNGLGPLAADLKKVLDDAKTAYITASSKPLIDDTDAKADLKKIADRLDSTAAKQLYNPTPPTADPKDSKPVVAKGPVLTEKDDKSDKAERERAEKEAERERAAKEAERERAAKEAATTDWGLEGKLLEAKAGGHRKAIEAAQRVINHAKLSGDLQDKQGIDRETADKLAEERLQLEDRANGKHRKGVLDEAATTAKRLARQNKRDIDDGLFNPQKAAAALKQAEADPGRRAREAAADRAWQAAQDQKKAAKELLTPVIGIHDLLKKVAVA